MSISHPDTVTHPGTHRRYADILQLDTLLSASREVPDHPDGRFFVVVHQAYELWFDLVLDELVAARDAMFADAAADALYALRRVGCIDRLLVAQIDTLATISPGGFVSLRTHLGTASGLQSVRFREIEYLSGLRERDFTGYAGRTGHERSRLLRRLREPSVWDGFCDLLHRRGLSDPAPLYESGRPDTDLVQVAEAMVDHDEAWATWRMRHAVLVERIIGRQDGTGGSSGVDYLNSRRDERFFPRLWQLRAGLGGGGAARCPVGVTEWAPADGAEGAVSDGR